MNTASTSSAQRCSNTETRSTDAGRPDDTRGLEHPREVFERALRAKAKQPDDEDAPSDAPASGLFAALMGSTPAQQPKAATPAPAGQIQAASTGPRAVIEAALNMDNGPVVTPVGGTDPAAVWEASIREPNSVAVEVRATRGEKSASATQAPVTLTIASSVVDASVLARHAPRLNERLRKHAVGPTHARIKGDNGDPQ